MIHIHWPSGRQVERATLARIAVGTALSLFVFFPALIEPLLPLRAVALALGIGAVLSEIWLSRTSRRRRTVASLAVVLAVGAMVAAAELSARILVDRMIAVNVEHLLVLAPLFGAFGLLAIRNGGLVTHARSFICVAGLTAVFAILESTLTISLTGRDFEFATSQREGITRALVGAEHVLVLGALLAAAAAAVAVVRPWVWRAPMTLLLLLGCWSTGSRAAAVFATFAVAIQAVPAVMRVIQRFWYVTAALVSIMLIVLSIAASTVWASDIPGATGVEFSANYRFASYAVLADVLAERPFGYLFRTVPTGYWMMDSELRGPVDLALSADSEIVFSVFAAGWLGIVVFVALNWISAAAIRSHPTLGVTTLMLTGLGFIMSLHGWDAASALWYTLLGASLGASLGAIRRTRTRSSIADSNDKEGSL